MAVSRGKNYERLKQTVDVQPGQFLEIGQLFRHELEQGKVYEVRSRELSQYKYAVCSDCDLERVCRISNKFTPQCMTTEREDGIGVYFKQIY